MIIRLINLIGTSSFLYTVIRYNSYSSLFFLANNIFYCAGYNNYFLSSSNLITNSCMIGYIIYSFPTMYPLTIFGAFSYYLNNLFFSNTNFGKYFSIPFVLFVQIPSAYLIAY